MGNAEVSEYDLLSLADLSRVGGGICKGALPMLFGGRDGGMLCILVNEPRRAYEVLSLIREV